MLEITRGDILFDPEPDAYKDPLERISVTGIIRWGGFGEDFSMVPRDVMQYALERGRIVHKACEYLDSGELDITTVDARVRPYVTAYSQFLSECHVRPIAVEKRLFFGPVAGTPDLVAFINGVRSIVDRKTGDCAGKYARLQSAGYKELWELNYPNALIGMRYGLKLCQNGSYRLVPHQDPDDIYAWRDIKSYVLAEQRIAKWMQKYGVRNGANGRRQTDAPINASA